MLMAYLALASGLFISAVAIYYSIVGLASIFAAAVIPIMIMGTALEVAKLVAASWLKQNWKIAPLTLKVYLTTAVAVLMLITSMGIFGYLSKAHLDQNIVSGEVMGKLSIYDEKIKTSKDNIDANRKALKQLDEAVDQVMGRSNDEKGADKAVALRRSQQKERARLQAEIAAEQKTISSLNEERAPIASEVRKVEAEVGPIKYIASLIYGSNPDSNVLEKAVTWVIILIVIVFDPLAVSLLLAAQFSMERDKKDKEKITVANEDGELTVDFLKTVTPEEPTDSPPKRNFDWPKASKFWPFPALEKTKEVPPPPIDVDHEDADNDVIVVDTTPEVEEPAKPEQPKKEIEILNNEYISIDGKPYYYNSMGGGDKDIASSVDLAKKLESTGEYVVVHTNKGVVVTDSDGKATEHTLDERPGDYVTPTYVQNEEQQQGGLWQKIQHVITEDEYIKKSEENKKGKA